MNLNIWVRQQIRSRIFDAVRGGYFDYQMFDIWAKVSTQAGFSVWDVVLDLEISDTRITTLLQQVIKKWKNEQRITSNVECFGLARRSA